MSYPIFASDHRAAKLMDLKPADFLRLVESGLLPKPHDIGGFKRWNVEELRRISCGDAAEGHERVKW